MNTIAGKAALFPGLLILLLLVYPFCSAQSQAQNQSSADAFDKAAAKHKRELERLWMARSGPIIRLPDVSAKSLAAVLATRSTSEAGYLANTAVLAACGNPVNVPAQRFPANYPKHIQRVKFQRARRRPSFVASRVRRGSMSGACVRKPANT